MSRWGQEEKKSKGLFGCFAALALLVILGVSFYQNYNNLEDRRKLEKEIQTVVHNSHRKTGVQIENLIMEAVNRLEIEVERDDIVVELGRDSHGNDTVSVHLDMPMTISYLVGTFEISAPINEEIALLY